MRVRAALAGLALAVAAASAAVAAPPSKAEMLAAASEAAGVCAQTMPNTRATADALKSRGFRMEEADGTARIYTKFSPRVVVLFTTVGSDKDACAILVSQMTPAEARQLVQPWIDNSKAVQVEQAKDRSRWRGVYKGTPIIIGTINQIDLGIVRGAAVVAGAPKR